MLVEEGGTERDAKVRVGEAYRKGARFTTRPHELRKVQRRSDDTQSQEMQ